MANYSRIQRMHMLVIHPIKYAERTTNYITVFRLPNNSQVTLFSRSSGFSQQHSPHTHLLLFVDFRESEYCTHTKYTV